MTDTAINERTFEMHGNGSTTFIIIDDVGSETVANIDVRDSYIVRMIEMESHRKPYGLKVVES